jgi:Glycosyltransferases, probably involved in cell wall biogenesis
MVSIITCTMRNSYMNNVFQNYVNQKVENKELIVVLNHDGMDLDKWRREAAKYKNVSVYQVPEKYNLGKCLNYGIERANHKIIAKFDDDNYYAPHYLKEAMDTLGKNRKISVVGKHTAYVYFERKKALMLFRRGGENQYNRRIKGGSLVFRKKVWRKIKFNERKTHTIDVDFLNRCRRRHYKIYSVSKYNYVCIRRANFKSHTQKISTKDYMKKCKLVSYTKNFVPIITKNKIG